MMPRKKAAFSQSAPPYAAARIVRGLRPGKTDPPSSGSMENQTTTGNAPCVIMGMK
jgi:hypothetical protein